MQKNPLRETPCPVRWQRFERQAFGGPPIGTRSLPLPAIDILAMSALPEYLPAAMRDNFCLVCPLPEIGLIYFYFPYESLAFDLE